MSGEHAAASLLRCPALRLLRQALETRCGRRRVSRAKHRRPRHERTHWRLPQQPQRWCPPSPRRRRRCPVQGTGVAGGAPCPARWAACAVQAESKPTNLAHTPPPSLQMADAKLCCCCSNLSAYPYRGYGPCGSCYHKYPRGEGAPVKDGCSWGEPGRAPQVFSGLHAGQPRDDGPRDLRTAAQKAAAREDVAARTLRWAAQKRAAAYAGAAESGEAQQQWLSPWAMAEAFVSLLLYLSGAGAAWGLGASAAALLRVSRL